MFIECYKIPIQDWNKKDQEIRIPDNKILISLNSIEYITSATHNPNRAVILLSGDVRINILASYEKILAKIENLGETTHIMNRLDD